MVGRKRSVVEREKERTIYGDRTLIGVLFAHCGNKQRSPKGKQVGNLFRVYYTARDSATKSYLYLADTQRKAGELESSKKVRGVGVVKTKVGEDLGVGSDWRLLALGSWKLSGQTRSRKTYVIVLRSIFDFLIGPEMEVRGKGEKLGKLALIDQILIWTDCAETEAWLPVLVAAEAIHQNCIIVCDPAIVHLNIVSRLSPSDIYSYWEPV